jgi:CRP-like cAMP-binding protein
MENNMRTTFCSDRIDAHRLLVKVSAGRTTASYTDNQKIFTQGDDADFVFFVQDGSVKLSTTSEQGLETLLGIAQQGQFFGETCLHDVPVRVATATAISDCRVTSVTKGAMLAAIHSQPRFAKMFIHYLSDNNSWLRKDFLDRLLKSPEAA